MDRDQPFFRALAILAPALLVAACSAEKSEPGPSPGTWRFSLIDGRKPLSPSAQIRFEGHKLAVQVGCNRMEGPWRVEEDRLIAGPLALSESSCATPAWDQENAVGALLVATPRLALDGRTMILQSSGHTAELVRTDEVAGNPPPPRFQN